MRRPGSLRARWAVALVAVCLVEAALMAGAVRLGTARAFDRFLREDALSTFVGDVAAHVRRAGSLDGFAEARRAARPPQARREERPPPPRDGTAPARPPPGRRPPGRRPPDGRPRGPRYGLADADGRVVLPFDGLPPGATIPPERLADGLPVTVDGRRVGTAFTRDAVGVLGSFPPDSPEARFVRASTQALAWATALSVLLALALGAWLGTRAARPLASLAAASRRIAGGELGARVAVESSDEVGQLADAFNAMSARLAEAHRLRTQMTADVSHDLRTPLTTILGTLEAIRSGALPATPARIAAAHDEAQRLRRLVDDLHTLALADARDLPLRLEPLDAGAVLAHVATAFEAEALAAGVALVVEAAGAPGVVADRDRLVQALGNLVGNALRHTPVGGRVTLAARADGAPEGAPEGDAVALSVADTGEGIAADVLPRVFERSVRGDASRAGGGAGLGLSIVRSLAEAMGGTATADSRVGAGTTITLRLPAARDAG